VVLFLKRDQKDKGFIPQEVLFMKETWKWFYEEKAQQTIKALKKHRFQADYFESQKKVGEWILEEAQDATLIGVGGSITVRGLGVLETLEQQGKTIFDHYRFSKPMEAVDAKRSQLTCDLFLSGANAITESGEIVNMDSSGNRVAAMAFGPKRVIVVAGINKLVSDIHQAFQRIRETVVPVNAKRLGLKTPCAETGKCSDCDAPQRICNVSMVLHRKPSLSDITVAIVGEPLGI
jgi:hypothetical protein